MLWEAALARRSGSVAHSRAGCSARSITYGDCDGPDALACIHGGFVRHARDPRPDGHAGRELCDDTRTGYRLGDCSGGGARRSVGNDGFPAWGRCGSGGVRGALYTAETGRGRLSRLAWHPALAEQAGTGRAAWRRQSAPGQGSDVQQRLCGDGAQSQGNRFLRGLRAAIHRSGTSCRCAMRGADCDLRDPGRT